MPGRKVTEAELKTADMLYALTWPTLKALRGLNGTAGYREINEKVLEETSCMDFSDVEELKYKPEHFQTILESQLNWARHYLKFAELVDRTGKGIWSLTADSDSIDSKEKTIELCKEAAKKKVQERKKNKLAELQQSESAERVEETTNIVEKEEEQEAEGERRWQDEVINILCMMDPYAFERFCGRLLTESGFEGVKNTKKTGDGGIDGYGKLRVNLISFKVGIQCKRFTESKVPSAKIDEFGGSLKKHGLEKGIFITTSRFTKRAKEAAEKLNIDLIDGEGICEVLERLKLGLRQEISVVDYDFFSKFSAGIKDDPDDK